MTQPTRRWLAPLLMYTVTAILCAYLLTVAMPLSQMNWDIPFQPDGDGLLTSIIVRTVLEQPWYLTNSQLGAPHGLTWYDFPMTEGLHIVMFKLVGLVQPNYARVLNVTFLLDFFLIAFAAAGVLRRLGLSYASSISAALLYAFAPYHFFRHESHFFLSAYFLIPPTTLMLLWVIRGEPMTAKGKGLASVVICLLVGSAGVYYAFFAAFFLLLAGLHQAIPRRSWRQALTGAALAAVIVAALLINLAPNLRYKFQHGPNNQIATRMSSEAESLGLRFFRMVLPVEHHRIPAFARIYTLAGRENEASSANLGLVASVGLMLLLIGALTGFPGGPAREVLSPLSFFTIWAIVLAASGGLGVVIAYGVTAQIRAYNRMSIYLAFFALVAFFLLAEWVLGKLPGGVRPAALTAFGAVVLAAGFLDQVPAPAVPAILARQAAMARVEEFEHAVENQMPPGATILQLPYMAFPESPPVYKISDYEPARPYLASKTLRWSYGATRGRHASAWLVNLTSLPLPEMVERAALAGFDGIWVDRFGYRAPGTEIDGPLHDILQAGPSKSRDDRNYFYDLRPFAARMQAGYSPEAWRRAREASLSVVYFSLDGCGQQERAPTTDWYWCNDRIQLVIENPTAVMREVDVDADLIAASPGPMKVDVDGPGIHEVDGGGHFRKTVTAPPGRTVLRFHTDAQPTAVEGDPRIFIMRFQNLRVHPRDAVEPTWASGCSEVERDQTGVWRWCSGAAELVLQNATGSPARVLIRMRLSAPVAVAVRIAGPGFEAQPMAEPAGAEYRQTVVIPAGESRIKLSSEGKKVIAPGDPRDMVFQVRDFEVKQ